MALVRTRPRRLALFAADADHARQRRPSDAGVGLSPRRAGTRGRAGGSGVRIDAARRRRPAVSSRRRPGASSRWIPRTGAERWTFDPKLARPGGNARHRGVAYWEGGGDRRIFAGTLDGRLVALDALTGQPKAEFGDNGQIQLAAGPEPALRHPRSSRTSSSSDAAAPEFPGARTGRRRAGVRRAHRSPGLGVPHRAARERTGQRHVGGASRGAAARAPTSGR